MVKLPSASRLSLAMKCAGSFILPQAKSDPGEAAKRGTAIHALVENYINSQRTTPEGLGETQRALLRKVDELLGPPAQVFERSELAVSVYPGDHSADIFRIVNGNGTNDNRLSDSVDDVQGRLRGLPVQGQNLDLLGAGWGLDCASEDRPALVFEHLFGSDEGNYFSAGKSARKDAGPDRSKSFLAIADCIRCHDESSYEVWDWKTGSSYVPEPQWNWQLILPAVGLWLCSGKRSGFRCSASIFYIDRDVGVNPRPYVYDSEFCSRALFFLKRLYDTAQDKTAETVDLYEGKHCVFCPARDRCPAKVGALAAALQAAGAGDILEDDVVMRALVAVTETSAMRKKAAESILEAHGGVFSLGDGREAVLDKSGKRTKIYTRKATSGQEERSNAQEDGQPGTEGEGAGADTEGGG